MQIKDIDINKMVSGKNERTKHIGYSIQQSNINNDTSFQENVITLFVRGIFVRFCLPMAARYASMEIIVSNILISVYNFVGEVFIKPKKIDVRNVLRRLPDSFELS